MKKILVPTDFSKPAQWAMDTALGVAKTADAELILLHVIEQPYRSFNVQGQVAQSEPEEEKLFITQMISKTRQRLKEAAIEVELAGVQVRQKLRMGSPFHGMRELILDEQVDLVVMGTSGKTKLEEMLIGSNTEKVVRYAKCPVLTVHEKPKTSTFRNIVYASSLSDDESAFSTVVKNCQRMYGSQVHLVRINTPANFRSDVTVLPVMEQFAAKNGLVNYTLNVFNDFSEEEGILHFAKKINADLIAMATHGRKGFAHVLVGSLAEGVANHATKPVLTYATKAH